MKQFTINTRVILLLLICILHMTLVFTNPTIKHHKDFYIETTIKSFEKPNPYILELAYCVAERHIKVDNYTIFSLCKLDEDGQVKIIGIGILGRIFPPSHFKEYSFFYTTRLILFIIVILFLWFKRRIKL
jgi:hypothetical protein